MSVLPGRLCNSLYRRSHLNWGVASASLLSLGRRTRSPHQLGVAARSTGHSVGSIISSSGIHSDSATTQAVANKSVEAMDGKCNGAPMKAFVRSLPEEESLTVSLVLAGRQRHLNRPKNELLEKCLTRIKTNAAPKESKRDRKIKGNSFSSSMDSRDDVASAMTASLFYDTQMTRPIDLATANGVAWMDAKALQVGEELFLLELNPPTVDSSVVIKRAMVGYPLLPAVKLSFADNTACLWKWSRLEAGSSSWQDIGCTAQLYVPSSDDVGCKLRVECTPRRDTDGAVVVGEPDNAETGIVTVAPFPTSVSVRCPQGPLHRTASPAVRVMTYNILADQYAGSTFAQNVLFNYCPPDSLDPLYRRQLVLQELLTYCPDIVCLQEVDEKVFFEYLEPHLQTEGFSGRYTNKMGKVKEGSATFWRSSRFQLAASEDVLLRDVFKAPLHSSHAHWDAMLNASPELAKALQKVTTVAQVTLLQPTTSASPQESPIAVVNTHLFFHPYAPHIRTIHTAAILEEAWALVQEQQVERQQSTAIMFCGDLNSDLNDGIPGVVELLQRGCLASDFWDWDMGAPFKWGMEEEDGSEQLQASAPKPPGSKLAQAADTTAAAVVVSGAVSAAATDADGPGAGAGNSSAPTDTTNSSTTPTDTTNSSPNESTSNAAPPHNIAIPGINLSLPFGALRSADDLSTPYTNYTSGYKALLDYVWIQDSKMEVLSSLSVPTETELGGFIPNAVFPSDHLAVVYDIQFKAKSAGSTSTA